MSLEKLLDKLERRSAPAKHHWVFWKQAADREFVCTQCGALGKLGEVHDPICRHTDETYKQPWDAVIPF